MVKKVFLLVLSSFSTLFCFGAENSVIPEIERLEIINNLSPKKYSYKQYAEISKFLEQKADKIRVVSYNILFNTYDHNLAPCYQWPVRLPRVLDLIETMQPDVMGVQELNPSQFRDLMPFLKDRYYFFTRSYDEADQSPAGDRQGEINGIFYRKERFKVVDQKVWKLPNSHSSDTLVKLTLEDLYTGKCVSVLNTHLSFGNVNQRETQARFIAEQIQKLGNAHPIIFMGDLNTFPSRLDLPKLPFYDGYYIENIFKAVALTDARENSLLGHLGPFSTFTNADEKAIPFTGTGTPGVFLDHIYVSKQITVLIHAVESGKVDGYFPSDHMPLVMDCLIK